MEAVGTLAGGVAHDFNNHLTVILSFAEFARTSLACDDPAREDLDEVILGARRSSRLVHQLLAFSRRQLVEPVDVDVNETVESVRKMLGRLIGEHIRLETRLQPQLPHAFIDPGQLEQVLMNLAVNARDAMPEGGSLTVATSLEILDDSPARSLVPPHIRVRVSDTGHGMDAETQRRAFDPFFTTKAVDRGTGLGLAILHGIVSQAGGSVSVESEVGVGTTFTLCLPLAQGEAVAACRPEPATRRARRCDERVLVVEDDGPIREVVRRALTDLGYRVQVASSPGEALLLVERAQAPFDLLLTDVVMPLLSGVELAARVVHAHPRLRVLFMTGYNDDTLAVQTLPRAGQILRKPFTPESLGRRVRAVLDQPLETTPA